MGCSIGVSTSMKPRSDSQRRISATVFERAISTSRARAFVARSRYRWRCRRSTSWRPERLSGHGRRDLASSSKPSTRIDSSPVRVVTTSPQAPTQSPTPRPRKSSKRSPRRAAWPKSWILPPQSPRSANATLPWPRVVWMRPATRWISPVAAPGSSEPYLAVSSPGVEVRSKRSGAPSDGAGIALVEEPEAHEGELGLVADRGVAGGEHLGRQPTGGEHRRLAPEGLGHPLDHPVHHRRGAEKHSGADRLHRRAPDDVLRCDQLHLLDLGGHPEEGVGGDLQPGGDGTPQVLAALADGVEGRGRPEVDDDQRRRDEVEGRDGVDDAVRADLPRVVGLHRQPGPDARRHHHRIEMEVPGNHFPEGRRLRRDDAAEHDPVTSREKERPTRARNCWKIRASSSAVRPGSVEVRHCATRLSLRKMPIWVWVLPVSTASSMGRFALLRSQGVRGSYSPEGATAMDDPHRT